MALSIREWLVQPQPRLGAAGLIILLVASSLITPLSLDMYTPAVPGMAQYFNTDVSMVNMTLVGYYVFFRVRNAVLRPLERQIRQKTRASCGRRPLHRRIGRMRDCPSIELLIAFRVIQALGAGSISAVCTAVVKDSFQTYYREKILSVIQVLFVVGPATAPVIGAGVLAVADWRATFLILSIVGVACFGLSLAFKETLSENERSERQFLANHEAAGRSW